MARTASKMLSLGTSLPNFNLLDTTKGALMQLEDLSSTKPCLVMFICNHCPFVIYLHEAIKEMVTLYGSKIEIVAISSNDVIKFPQDGPMLMQELFKKLKLTIPYLYDEEQVVAKAFNAACTPDFYLFNTLKKLVYRGQFDDSRPGNDIPITGYDLLNAVENLLQGKDVNPDQKPSLGCNIKWK